MLPQNTEVENFDGGKETRTGSELMERASLS